MRVGSADAGWFTVPLKIEVEDVIVVALPVSLLTEEDTFIGREGDDGAS